MAFQPTDLYLPSGTGTLINNWVDPVYKFDSSSFYNWEQDNLPIYDLEDRDDFLYEMAGYPTSAVDGIMLTVSACGIDNKKVFGTVADALEALPNTIRFPIIIEVCTSGPLGGIHVENKEFEGSSAGLEIINRGFAKVLCGSSTSPSAIAGSLAANSSGINQIVSTDLSNTMLESSSLGVSDTVWQKNPAGAWSWWGNFTRTFILAPEWSIAAPAATKTISLSTKFTDTTNDFLDTVPNSFNVGLYTDNSTSGETQITNPHTGTLVQRTAYPDTFTTSRVTGFVYANAASGVTVKDCAGKVYIRGFCVDGAEKYSLSGSVGEGQRTNIGFDIQNSEVLIENCTAARCKDAGLQAINSHVTLNRGFIAFRNYELDTVGGSVLDHKVTTNPTPGLRALTSTITLSATPEDKLGLPLDSPFCFYKNMIGIELQNSVLQTPEDFRYGRNALGEIVSQSNGSETLVLQTFFNINEGIKAVNSTINTGQNIASFQNDRGITLDNSVLAVTTISVDHNKNEGIKAVNSTLNYNQHAEDTWLVGGAFYPTTSFDNNGQHLVFSNSQVIPTMVDDVGTKYTRFGLSGTHGMEVITTSVGGKKYTSLPAVVLTDGSHMKALFTRAEVHQSIEDGNAYSTDNAVKGSMFQVTKGSTLELNGGSRNSTMILGPYAASKQQKTAALYAGANSHISITGPTSIVQFGVNALAEDHSTIEIGPPMKDGLIDVSSFGLGDTDEHTKVQLHATRACLVANKNSHIYMHDAGDYHRYWASKHLADINYDYDTATLGTSGFTSHGYIQFYPNPFTPYGAGDNQLDLQAQAGWCADNTKVGLNDSNQQLYKELPQQDGAVGDSVSSLSYGGMCVRAVGESEVTARNVTFPTGWANPSGPYYDASTTGNCDLLRIWNIADNSELHASYLTVSSCFPEDASGTYYGPSAVWASAFDTGLSGAPSSTLDTSGLSVLDSFGYGVSTGPDLGFYGKPEHQNIGPFRIYVSPHPKAKWLGYVLYPDGTYYMPPQNPAAYVSMGFTAPNTSTLKIGAPYQLYAQGYSTSSDCSSLDPATASGIYQDLGMSGHIITLPSSMQVASSANPHYVASSFFYTSAMLSCDNETRIWLDESAMNTFANAKNGTLGTSGRKKIFSYYKAIVDYPGEAWWQANTGFGRGLGSANLFDLDREL